MSAPRYAENAAKAFAAARSGDGPAPSAAARAAAIAAVEGALRAKRTRAKRRRAIGVGLTLAAALALGIGVTRLHHSAPAPVAMPTASGDDIVTFGHPTGAGAMVETGGQWAPLVDGVRLAKGSRVVARADGAAMLALSTGTKLSLREGGELAIESEGSAQRFMLTAGAVRAEVAKLVGDQRFVVRTPDTEVEVHGTVFEVSQVPPSPTCGSGTSTRVAVVEGVVTVRHAGIEVKLHPGESWPQGCTTASVEAPRAPAPALAHVTRPRAARRGLQPVPANEVNTPSRLAEQNELFAHGKAARRAGDVAGAVADFDELVRNYPGGPLTEAAMVERMRTLRDGDPARAHVAAREYLRSFPAGFAVTEAQTLLDTASAR